MRAPRLRALHKVPEPWTGFHEMRCGEEGWVSLVAMVVVCGAEQVENLFYDDDRKTPGH